MVIVDGRPRRRVESLKEAIRAAYALLTRNAAAGAQPSEVTTRARVTSAPWLTGCVRDLGCLAHDTNR